MNAPRHPIINPLAGHSMTRRGFVATSITAGYTLAAGPVIAQTIVKTGSEGLVEGVVTIPTAGGFQMNCYRARPEKPGRYPVVLVVQEIFGVHEYIRDTCRRLAKLGYLAMAADLFQRQEPRMAELKDVQAAIAISQKVSDKQMMEDLDATVAYAEKSGEGMSDKLAITGFCFGGRVTWLYAAHNPKVKAAVAWYGRLVGPATEQQPKQPVDLASEMKAPVLGLYGAADEGIPVASVEQMKAAMAATGKKAEFVIYPNTPHGFHADYRPSYRPEAADDGWKRLQAWFKTNGVG